MINNGSQVYLGVAVFYFAYQEALLAEGEDGPRNAISERSQYRRK